jgi:hypothetical protein
MFSAESMWSVVLGCHPPLGRPSVNGSLVDDRPATDAGAAPSGRAQEEACRERQVQLVSDEDKQVHKRQDHGPANLIHPEEAGPDFIQRRFMRIRLLFKLECVRGDGPQAAIRLTYRPMSVERCADLWAY